MTRTTRRILFYIAIAIFLGAAYIIILYAQGYQYNFSTGQFVRSGAIYLKVNTGANVLIDGKEAGNTSLLSNSASIGSLLPADHIVSVQKQGWSVWQKKVTITAGFVEDYTHVMLLPQIGQDKENVRTEIHDLLYPPVASPSVTPSRSPTPTATPKKTPKPTPTPSPTPSPTPDHSGLYYIDNSSLFVRGQDGAYVRIAGDVTTADISNDNQKLSWFSEGQIWVYWFSDTNYQPFHHAGDIALVTRFNYPIKAAEWFRDNDHIAVDAGGLKVIEVDTRGGLNIINF